MNEQSKTNATPIDGYLAVSGCTFTEFSVKKNVSIICKIVKGDKVTVRGWGYELDGKEFLVEDIKLNMGGCESGILVKIDGYKSYIDSGWISRLN